jgi:hypothetical protein
VVTRAPVPTTRVAASIKTPKVIGLRARINHPTLIRAKALFETILVTAQLREPLDRTPMEMVRAVIARTVVAASAVADEDADAADAAVVVEAKAAIATLAQWADHPWAPAVRMPAAVRMAAGQRIRSLPRPHRYRRVTVATITTRVVPRARPNSRTSTPGVATRSIETMPRSSVSLGSPSRLVSRNRSTRRSRSASRRRSFGHSRLSSGPHLLLLHNT